MGGVHRADSWQIDLALGKTIILTERVAMEFGVQAFNILNHVQLGDSGTFTLSYDTTVPGTNLSVPGNFGVIATTNNFNNNNDNAASSNTGTPVCLGRYNLCFASSSSGGLPSKLPASSYA